MWPVRQLLGVAGVIVFIYAQVGNSHLLFD